MLTFLLYMMQNFSYELLFYLFNSFDLKIMDGGRGIHELWNQQLQQFYGVRHETSVAITQRYPTPRSLMEVD